MRDKEIKESIADASKIKLISLYRKFIIAKRALRKIKKNICECNPTVNTLVQSALDDIHSINESVIPRHEVKEKCIYETFKYGDIYIEKILAKNKAEVIKLEKDLTKVQTVLLPKELILVVSEALLK